MDGQRAKAQAFGCVGYVGTVDTAAEAHDAIVVLAFSGSLDPFGERRQFCLAAAGGSLIDDIADHGIVLTAVVADSFCIEADIRIAGIHHAPSAYLIRA
ncbi:hypothetical protein WJ971_05330 [Achromobacter xylosoxidans]